VISQNENSAPRGGPKKRRRGVKRGVIMVKRDVGAVDENADEKTCREKGGGECNDCQNLFRLSGERKTGGGRKISS